jgi:hypothetical protein
MLGVELGEEFKIKGFNGVTYRFANDGLRLTPDDGPREFDTTANMALIDLLSGVAEIVKLPWKPKAGDEYYSFGCARKEWFVRIQQWTNHPLDLALLDKGWVYRSRAEAEAALPKVAKEMGVEYKL